jgi:hypothetical protein
VRTPRMTTRRWMIVVIGAAIVLRASEMAYREMIDTHSRYVYHIWARKDSPYDEPDRPMIGTVCYAPFWSRYWRGLLGQSWPGTYKCSCDDPRYAINGAVSQFYSIVGSRAGPDPSSSSPSDGIEVTNSLLREYDQAHKPGHGL